MDDTYAESTGSVEAGTREATPSESREPLTCHSCGATVELTDEQISGDKNLCPHCGADLDDPAAGTHHVDHRNAYPARHRVAPDQLDRLAN